MDEEKKVYLVIDTLSAYDDDGCIKDTDDFVDGVITQFPEIEFFMGESDDDCMLEYGMCMYDIIKECDELWVFTSFFDDEIPHEALEYAEDLDKPVIYDKNMW